MKGTNSGIRKKRRISFVTRKIAGRSGGAERVLVELANELARRGHAVEILSYEPRRRPAFYPTRFGVVSLNLRYPNDHRSRVRRIFDRISSLFQDATSSIGIVGPLRWQFQNAGFVRALRRHFKYNKPDTIVAWMPPAYAPCLAANNVARALLVASTHNEPSQDYINPERWDRSSFDRRRRLSAATQMDCIVILLDEYKNWYAPGIRPKIRVIPNAVREIAPHLLKPGQRENVILSVGRLAEVKRHDVLVRAWAKIAGEFPAWSVKIFGVGPEREALEQLIDGLGVGNSVTLMGHTLEIEAEYLKARLLCHPAKFEGFPLAVTEALAHGVPVTGFEDCSGLNALVQDGKNGKLMRASEDREAVLAAALRELLRDPPALERLGEAAPASMSRYRPEAIYDSWEKLLSPDHPETRALPGS